MITTFSTEKLRFEPNGGYAQRFLKLTSAQQMLIVRAETACDKAWRSVYEALKCRNATSGVIDGLEAYYSLAQARVIQLRRSLVWKGLSA